METALREFSDSEPSLEYRLWHVCANRIATTVLMKQVSYQGWTKEKIKLRLENSFLFDSSDSDTFTVDATMSDVVLVNGKGIVTSEGYNGYRSIAGSKSYICFDFSDSYTFTVDATIVWFGLFIIPVQHVAKEIIKIFIAPRTSFFQWDCLKCIT